MTQEFACLTCQRVERASDQPKSSWRQVLHLVLMPLVVIFPEILWLGNPKCPDCGKQISPNSWKGSKLVESQAPKEPPLALKAVAA